MFQLIFEIFALIIAWSLAKFAFRILTAPIRIPIAYLLWRKAKKRILAESVQIGLRWGGDMAMEYLRENPRTFAEAVRWKYQWQ